MPMVEFRYNRKKISDAQAQKISDGLMIVVQRVFAEVRPEKTDFHVFVEGDPFNVQTGHRDLKICIFYHEEWDFDVADKIDLAKAIGEPVKNLLKECEVEFGVDASIRFYARTGHISARAVMA